MNKIKNVLLIICSLTLFLYATYSVINSFYFSTHSKSTLGTILLAEDGGPIKGGEAVNLKIQFSDERNQIRQNYVTKLEYFHPSPIYSDWIGEKINLIYRTDQPDNVVIDDLANYWITFWLVPLVFIILALIMFKFSLNNLRNSKTLNNP